jgi:hypothetical protein
VTAMVPRAEPATHEDAGPAAPAHRPAAEPDPGSPRAVRSGATVDNLLALQRSAGNRAVAGLMRPDAGDVGTFLVAVTDAYGPCPLGQVPEVVGNTDPHLRSLETRLAAAWTLARAQDDAAPARLAAHWDRLRPELAAVGVSAAGQGFDPGEIARYQQAVRAIEHRFVRWYSREVVDAGADLADVGDPEAAFKEQIAKQAAAASGTLLTAVERAREAEAAGRADTLGHAKAGAKAVGEVTAGSTGKAATTVRITADVLEIALDVLARGTTMEQKIADLAKAGLLKQAATAADLTAFLVDLTRAGGMLVTRYCLGGHDPDLLNTR